MMVTIRGRNLQTITEIKPLPQEKNNSKIQLSRTVFSFQKIGNTNNDKTWYVHQGLS